MTYNEELLKWKEDVEEYHLPRWDDLPDIDLYMDQVITLIENYLMIFNPTHDKKIITSSMVNNYVKLKLIPKPVKKRYTKKHLAYLIAISILKQVITIPEVRNGIVYQASVNGIREAYNLFCSEQEYALKAVASRIGNTSTVPLMKEDCTEENILVRNATLAVATKIATEKLVASLVVAENQETKSN
ncbi:DUF1836 domain-containing protein [Desemzia sp. RIT804]|uniref:DUF1836 domain-containing protein n=1 Tax=Desemzia sp. RIT 804 TaxID=2810209 RepID=UPI001951905E|nr:DUF1836 domain-containing protein [Desemzia sp. RIT 804]MBM6613924.1 DUF1836 domain-containing protein [Desemzia sp. RIT 804]